MTASQHIVVLGGGFAGRCAAQYLAYELPPQDRVTLVDQNDYLLYTPLLPEVLSGTMSIEEVVIPVDSLPPRVEFVQAGVRSVDCRRRQVRLDGERTLDATQLVLALGSAPEHNVPGAREFGVSMKSLADIVRVQEEVGAAIKSAAMERSLRKRLNWLTFVVVGGGCRGVSIARALNVYFRSLAIKYELDPQLLRGVLIEPCGRLMAEVPESLALYARRQLENDGVEVMTSIGITKVERHTIQLDSGHCIPNGLLIWNVDARISPRLENADLPRGKHGGISVDSNLRVSGVEGIWAIGDCAEVPQENAAAMLPGTAQRAMAQGKGLAKNIAAATRGEPPQPVIYKKRVQVVLVSRGKGIANFYGIRFAGRLAWLLWWITYLLNVPDGHRRFGPVRGIAEGRLFRLSSEKCKRTVAAVHEHAPRVQS